MSIYVTDTHPLVWYALKDFRRLSAKAKAIFDATVIERRSAIIVPTAVLWEVSLNMKSGRSRIVLDIPYEMFLERLFDVSTMIEEPINRQIVARSHQLNFHDDPFDTLIVATAIEKDFPLITNDSVIHNSQPCDLIW